MRLFTCDTCAQVVFFDNDTCLQCGSPLGLRPSTGDVEVIEPTTIVCANRAELNCNWLVEDDQATCRSCRLTRATAPIDDPGFRLAVAQAEAAKRRMVWQCLVLGLPVERLSFDLVSSRLDDEVMIGHENGLITVDVEEADDAWRVEVRERMHEPYRTLLGHFRHEVGHGLFPAMAFESGRIEEVRALFGDERADYQEALDRHYSEGPPDDWGDEHVSEYATMHPSEDWAETFAHWLHIRDTLETASQWGLRPTPPATLVTSHVEGMATGGFTDLVDAWLPLTYALNAVNRSMGADDLYPFVLSPRVVARLALVQDLARTVSPT